MLIMHGTFPFRGFWPTEQENKVTSAAAYGPPGSTYSLNIIKQSSQSRTGSVLLRSADPRDTPDITLNLYDENAETDDDMAAMKDAVAWARRVYASVRAPYGPIQTTEPPCRDGHGPDGLGDWPGTDDCDEEWITGQTYGYLATSSCKTSSDDDGLAVLDSKFRVRGVEGLRVVDGSAFPRLLGVLLVTATFLIGKKAADEIIEEIADVQVVGV